MRITNTNQKGGFIPLISSIKGIYAGNAVVKNHGGKAYIKVANILSIPIQIEAPNVILEDFEEITINNHKTTTFRNKYESNNPEELTDKFIFANKAEKKHCHSSITFQVKIE